MTRISCSVPILTLNSGATLEKCLQSLVDFEDVFLLDGNSTDDTKEIAERYGRPVYKQVETDEPNQRISNFTEMREKAARLTKYDWNLQLDSDEFLSPELVEEIRGAIESSKDNYVAFNIQKKYVIGEKFVLHAFNYPSYIPRLHNKKSGVWFKPNKSVHEQMEIPDNVRVINLKHAVWSGLPNSYRECVKKDHHQLALMKEGTFYGKMAEEGRLHHAHISVVYMLRAGKILLKSMYLYIRRGYKNSLPFGHVLRHVRIHLIVSFWKFQLACL